MFQKDSNVLCVYGAKFIIFYSLCCFLFPKVELHSAKDEEILKLSPFVNWELLANESHM